MAPEKIKVPFGFYMVLEGGEGCGKSTQRKLLVQRLLKDGYDVFDKELREPGTTPAGEAIRSILLSSDFGLNPETQAFLYLAARADVFPKVINPALDNGQVVVADRSGLSTKSYQGYAGGVNLGFIDKANAIALRGRTYSFGIIIDVNHENALEKIAQERKLDDMERKGLEFHKKVNEGYREIVRQDPPRFSLVKYREGNIQGMADEIYQITKDRIDKAIAQRSK